MVSPQRLWQTAHAGLQALAEEAQIECEEELLERVATEGSAERAALFQLTPRPEEASRDRRSGLWQEALREVAVSPDHLYRFVRLLSGGLNEQVSDLLKGEDADVLEVQRQIRDQRKEVVRRTIAFQGRILEQVLGTVFKSSALTLDLANVSNTTEALTICSAEAKKARWLPVRGGRSLSPTCSCSTWWPAGRARSN